jgi:nucleotide-binding universal stress UspA family protein
MFKKIFLAVDGSESSRQATKLAADLAKSSGGEVVVFHAREREFAGRAGIVDIESSAETLELVDETVRTLKDADVSARGDVRNALIGTVAKEIVDAAAAEGADVIVMGTRGLSDWSGFFLGSVTHRVIHAAEVPVLVTR